MAWYWHSHRLPTISKTMSHKITAWFETVFMNFVNVQKDTNRCTTFILFIFYKCISSGYFVSGLSLLNCRISVNANNNDSKISALVLPTDKPLSVQNHQNYNRRALRRWCYRTGCRNELRQHHARAKTDKVGQPGLSVRWRRGKWDRRMREGGDIGRDSFAKKVQEAAVPDLSVSHAGNMKLWLKRRAPHGGVPVPLRRRVCCLLGLSPGMSRQRCRPRGDRAGHFNNQSAPECSLDIRSYLDTLLLEQSEQLRFQIVCCKTDPLWHFWGRGELKLWPVKTTEEEAASGNDDCC